MMGYSKLATKDPKRRIKLAGGKEKQGKPVDVITPGANDSASRELLETDPSLIVYVNAQTGNDANTGDQGDPLQTYGAAVTAVGASSKTTIEWETDDLIVDKIEIPTQCKVGVIGQALPLKFSQFNSIALSSAITALGISENGVAVAGSQLTTEVNRSLDGGENWVAPTTGIIANLGPRDVATNDSGVWVLVGENEGATASNYLQRSIDDGDNWATPSTPPLSGLDEKLSVRTDKNGVWVAAGGNGPVRILRSIDNGASFTDETSGLPVGMGEVSIVETDGSGNWLAIGELGGQQVLRSTDNGLTWFIVSASPLGGIAARGIATDKNGRWVIHDNSEVAVSDDFGSSWTVVTTIANANHITYAGFFIISAINGFVSISKNGDSWQFLQVGGPSAFLRRIASSPSGQVLVGGNDGANPDVYFNDENFTSDICGFEIFTTIITDTLPILIQQCNFNRYSTSQNLDIRKSRFESVESDTNFAKIFNNLIVSNLQSFSPIKINGAAASIGDIDIEFNTIVAFSLSDIAVEIDNDASSTGLEQLHNNIYEGGVLQTYTGTLVPFKVNGNIRGSIVNCIPGDFLTSSDPLFLAPSADDYRLQRESGYDDTTKYDFDSPLIGVVSEGENAVEPITISTGQRRDPGAFAYDDQNVIEQFSFNVTMTKPTAISFRPRNTSRVHDAVSGEPDIYNEVSRRGQAVILQWQSLPQEDLAVVEFLERKRNTEVYVIFDDEDRIDFPAIEVNGAQGVGTVVLEIQPAVIFPISILTIDGYEYSVFYGLDASNSKAIANVTKLVLFEPLKTAVSDAQSISLSAPIGEGSFIYDPSANPGYTIANPDNIRKDPVRGFSMTLRRRKAESTQDNE